MSLLLFTADLFTLSLFTPGRDDPVSQYYTGRPATSDHVATVMP